MSTQVSLGDTIKHKDLPHRVVRIVKSISLFEPQGGEAPYIQNEEYIELKNGAGEIDFLVLSCAKMEYNGKTSPIKAPEPIPTKAS